jgi:ABC-2 type transport system ATP-binding protein
VTVLSVSDLSVTYRTALRRRRVEAVRGASFAVERGEIFGFLGPNGAGKTSTIRALMGLIAIAGGEARIFGHRVPSRDARARLGFLPEAPYFYDYLTVFELVDLAGRLFGLDATTRRRRADELIDLVGLHDARNTPVKKYSKGMLQRAGIAQALINDPELVVFDEPMSGLDPIGRKEVRDVVLSLRDQGKTVFFSTHILPDVEMVCDRVAIIVSGRVQSVGSLAELVESRLLGTELVLRLPEGERADAVVNELGRGGHQLRRLAGQVSLTLPPDADVDAFLARARERGGAVISVVPRHRTLEDVFLEAARGEAA